MHRRNGIIFVVLGLLARNLFTARDTALFQQLLVVDNESTRPLASASLSEHRHQQPVSVYCYEDPPFVVNELCIGLAGSQKLKETNNPHDAQVTWVVGQNPFKQKQTDAFVALLNESMHQRIQRHNPNQDLPRTQEMLNQVDPSWKVFVVDGSDLGHGGWFESFLGSTLARLVGWKRLHFVTRTTQHFRFMDRWTKKLADKPFARSLGCPRNFTHRLGHSFASVQHLSLNVREDILQSVEEYANTTIGAPFNTNPRPTDVRTFWNASICNKKCSFRNFISDAVHQLNKDNRNHYKVNTDVVGHFHHAGRKQVHSLYIDALMPTKTVVLAQRDTWEGHFRTMEALLSGALVFEDARTLYYPHGLKDGVNVVLYYSIPDLLEKLRYYLDPAQASQRIEMGRQGRILALEHHRLVQRTERILLVQDETKHNEYGVLQHTTNQPTNLDLWVPFSERHCPKQPERD